ncbi:lipoic acid synthetase [Mycetocola sp. BIGb0189]|nr:lipoic acid synthetase [Mycetocola sp. BIGb0189]
MSARNLGSIGTPPEATAVESSAPMIPASLGLLMAEPPGATGPGATLLPTVAGEPLAAPEGRKMLRIETRNTQTPIEHKPSWIKTRAKMGPEYRGLQQLVKTENLHTVCQEAGCPNIFECWEDREATFLIGGAQCTRRCDFCQIDTGKPSAYDRDEPRRVADSVLRMALRYATVTGVARDDLDDEGAWLHAETVRAIHEANPETGVEILATDFSGDPELLDTVFASRPEVFAHNVETVPRLFKRIRPAFRYERSLGVITRARDAGLVTKSNLILGMGEEPAEVLTALEDLQAAGTDIITITQYLRPSPRHLPVARWVRPEEFLDLEVAAREIGFSGVLAGPLVRSSYRAGRLWAETMRAQCRPIPESLAHLDRASSAPQAVHAG